jgi:predicted DNA-binding protein
MRIDVGSVLRHSANLPYADLVTRSTGAAVRRCIEAEIAAMGTDDVVTLDFTHIGMMDYSCADEVVAQLLLDLARRGGRPSSLVFHGITDAHLEAIEDVLLHHGLALVVHFADGAARLVGAVSEEERNVWQLVHTRGATHVDQLAAESSRESSELLIVLEALHDRRLLRRDGPTFSPIGVVS